MPWWSNELSDLVQAKHKLGRRLGRLNERFKKLNTMQRNSNLIILVIVAMEIDCIKPEFNRINAKFRKEVIKARKTSWEEFVSGVSINTSNKQMWDKFRKIEGKHIRLPRSPILHNGNRIHGVKDISDILGQHFATIGSETNLDQHFLKIKKSSEKVIINFETNEELFYNKEFTVEELQYVFSV